MSADDALLDESADDLYENAPCGYLSTRVDGSIVRVNRTFEEWTGFSRTELLAGMRFQDLLSPGGRIYHETHFAPLLQMQGSVREVAIEIVRADKTRLPALINSVIRKDAAGVPRLVRSTVFDASDRRRYERELLAARQREREIAVELQNGLLSQSLPSSAELELKVAYRPGLRGTEVGGDWYDAFPAGESGFVLVVGDVVGHGIEAAAEMGQLRSAVRALAGTGLGPGQLLTALDGYSERHGVGKMATLVCAQFEPGSGDLRYSCAGHPPPLILPAGHGGQFAWEGRSPPLGSIANGCARGEAHCHLLPGTTIVFYTDGLVERRTRSFDEGLEQLLAAASERRGDGLVSLVHGLVRALHDPAQVDDLCVLAVRSVRDAGVARTAASGPYPGGR